MKIYFAGSIRGGRDDAALYEQVINEVSKYGTVLTEHVGSAELSAHGETQQTDEYIFTRDVAWIHEADAIVAEVSTPSLGVGYELGLAHMLRKKTLCLFRPQEGKRLSAMVEGNAWNTVREYQNIEDVQKIFAEFFQESAHAEKSDSLVTGLYQHYKGKQYELIGTGRHTETLEEYAVYRALYDSSDFGRDALWICPKDAFTQNVTLDGQSVPRFTQI